MKKYTKEIIIVIVLAIIFIVALLISGKSGMETINYQDYKNLSNNSVVYIGNDKEIIDILKKSNISKDYNVIQLDYSKLNDSEKKKVQKDSVEIWKDKKQISKYNIDQYKLKKGDKKTSLENVDINSYLKLKDAKGLHFMFIGRETCGYCTKFKEAIKELNDEYKIQIYYIDTDTLNEKEFNKLVASDEYLSSSEWGTPTSFIYLDGNKIDQISGYVDSSSILSTFNKTSIKAFLIENKVV